MTTCRNDQEDKWVTHHNESIAVPSVPGPPRFGAVDDEGIDQEIIYVSLATRFEMSLDPIDGFHPAKRTVVRVSIVPNGNEPAER